MKTSLNHLQVNIREENKAFYQDLMAFLGWKTLYEFDWGFGVGGDEGGSLWFVGAGTKDVGNDYDGPGVNHVGIGAPAQDDIDAVVGYLKDQGIEALFGTPMHRDRPGHEGHTYYNVMFASPDNVLFEVEYTGPKS